MSKEAEKLAAEIVSYLFDDYPGNDQVRRDAVQEVARRTTTALTAARAEGEAVGLERAAEYVGPIIAARCTCLLQRSHEDDCEANSAVSLRRGIRALLPDPSFLSRREDAVRAEVVALLRAKAHDDLTSSS